MQKTKMGVSVGLVGAALYFLGAISILPAMLLAGYVLLVEENEWLRKAAVKMVTIVIIFNLLYIGIDLIQSAFSVLNWVVGWMLPFTVKVPFNLDNLLELIITVIKNVLLVIMGINALSLGTVKSKFFDNIIDKHMY